MNRNYDSGGSSPGRGGTPLGVAVVIGVLLGLCIALGVALYINKSANPFLEKQKQPASPPGQAAATGEQNQAAVQSKAEPKPKLDFYKILPGREEAVTDKEFKPSSKPAAKDVFFLQVAAFQNPADADNLKARLALAGIESRIQTAQLPDGKIWHRVRVGPFHDMNELEASRAALKQNNLEANLIRVKEAPQ